MNFDDFDFSSLIRKDYDGKQFDMTEYVGDWNGYEVHLGYTREDDYILLTKGKKAWYASEEDCQEIRYLFDL